MRVSTHFHTFVNSPPPWAFLFAPRPGSPFRQRRNHALHPRYVHRPILVRLTN